MGLTSSLPSCYDITLQKIDSIQDCGLTFSWYINRTLNDLLFRYYFPNSVQVAYLSGDKPNKQIQVIVKCKNCGFEFPAATQMNEEALTAINIENNNESCPKCKRTSAYNKSDYYFK